MSTGQFLPSRRDMDLHLKMLKGFRDGINDARQRMGKAPISESDPHWERLADLLAEHIFIPEWERRNKHQNLLARRQAAKRSLTSRRNRRRMC